MINPKTLLTIPLIAAFTSLLTVCMIDISRVMQLIFLLLRLTIESYFQSFQAFIACAYGIHFVGYFFVAWGVSSSLFSLAIKYIIKLVGRYVTLSFAFLIELLTMLYLWLIWDANNSNHIYAIFVLSVFLGVFESIFNVVLNSKQTSLLFCTYLS